MRAKATDSGPLRNAKVQRAQATLSGISNGPLITVTRIDVKVFLVIKSLTPSKLSWSSMSAVPPCSYDKLSGMITSTRARDVEGLGSRLASNLIQLPSTRIFARIL
jgi:hypothetical protein